MPLLSVLYIVLFGLFMSSCSSTTGADTKYVQDRLRIKPVRAMHFVLSAISLERAKWLVDQSRASGFNTIIVGLTNGVVFVNSPWKPLSGAWTSQQFLDWVDYARRNGIAVIPELQLLTHQEKFLQSTNIGLLYNFNAYDPRQDKVYSIVFPLLDELIGLVHPSAIHIGHDEVVDFAKYQNMQIRHPGEQTLPAELYYKDIVRIHDYLKQKHVETWMWGDMLISNSEFPSMNARDLHGNIAGYGRELRIMLPRDIVICDWHYEDTQLEYASLAEMRREGFRVIGSTFEKPNTTRYFSRYAAMHGASGMIATTWFHVQTKNWDVIADILHVAGDAFGRDFPDGK